MHYYNWNNAIGNELFNPNRAGQSVYICLTKEHIIETGRHHEPLLTDQDDATIWNDFCGSVRRFSENNSLVAGLNQCIDEQGRVKV